MDNNKKVIKLNPRFKELYNNKARRIIMYGSRSSSKSAFTCTQIIINMISHKYFKGIALRKYAVDLKDSCYKGLKQEILNLGLEHIFSMTESPMCITCKTNNNQMIFRGLDEPSKLKSITDPSFCWYEEDIPDSYQDYLTISLSLRTHKADYIQEIFTINPMISNYEDHWFWKKYFKDRNELSFEGEDEVEYKGIIYKQKYVVHQSTWRDNLLLLALKPEIAIAFEEMKNTDPIAYQQQSLGLWCHPNIKDKFWKDFELVKNTVDKKEYDYELPVHLSWDFNNAPYSACTIYQGDKNQDNTIYLIKEICLKAPRNKLVEVIKEVSNLLVNHKENVYIYGDPNGYRDDTTKELGDNAYKMIFGGLKHLKTVDRTIKVYPSVRASQNWINDILAFNSNIKFFISRECRNSINDFTMLKEDPIKGGTLKEKWKDPETGIKCEKVGHISDTVRYFFTEMFKTEYEKYKNGGVSENISYGIKKVSRHSW